MFQALSRVPRFITWGLAFPLLFLNGWLLLLVVRELEPLVSILISATVIAFLLDYPIRFLAQLNMPRGISVTLVFLVFIFLLITLGFFLGPLILRQANELLTRLPEWIESGRQQLNSLETWAAEQQLPIDIRENVVQNIAQLGDRLSRTLRLLTGQLVSLVFGAIGSIVNVFLTIVFAAFLVLRGESLWTGLLSWLPAQWNTQIREFLPDNFERFIVGQVTLATILSVEQTTTLFILGVPLALLFGVVIGACSLVPLGGVSSIIVVSLLLALQNFWLGVKVLLIALIVLQINDNVVGPRIIGDITGLNPVWMLISLFIGLKIAGGLGLIISVPIASFIKETGDRIRASKFDPLATAPPTTLLIDAPEQPLPKK
ncbi:AI-2E family transporter [Leptolyngbya sp. FACHB-711]|uniref:AI-2E family transporter n=1 Tax=unclassified Leptolyngbya TaxID=2650499 RepID=UPI0016882767|nr:AI-2E family transporter [Leptolyngbya sp. FACHB-711]MBD1851246.1 AI-2E family transporter [Cyanobacteria bacterium FACHB-502]MBD2027620.1 AI-2E family transporter [Leptolyngbya sp. FACHB-711]